MRVGIAILIWAIGTWSSLACAQGTSQVVYQKAQNSVFLIYLNGSSGEPQALGSGFLIAPHKIATNAHVVAGGTPVIAVGPARLTTKVTMIDIDRDLAILSVDDDIAATPLILSTAPVSVGQHVFAIGNPEGLEKTFSEGMISGVRELDDEDFIQLTTPISHGSSGGPILNERGEVVGVATAFMKDGQNLNFAIPALALKGLLEKPTQYKNYKSIYVRAKTILEARNSDTYSEDSGSPYQEKTTQVNALLKETLQSEDPVLLDQAALETGWESPDFALAAARKSFAKAPSTKAKIVLANAISKKCAFEKDSECKALLQEALIDAKTVTSEQRHGQRLALSTLAFIYGELDQPNLAVVFDQQALTASSSEDAPDDAMLLRWLTYDATASKQLDLASRSFEQLRTKGDVTAEDWKNEAERRSSKRDYAGAAEAFQQAAQLSQRGYLWCEAVLEHGEEGLTHPDQVLEAGRKCISSQTLTPSKDVANLDSVLSLVNTEMSMVLHSRGVDSEAFNYARTAITEDSQSYLAFEALGEATFSLQRFQETVASEREALRLSDGKYPYEHFRLGTAYYALEQWTQAEREFEVAAEADPRDVDSAFNAALALGKQGFTNDELQWLRKALGRNPGDEQRRGILQVVQQISR